MILLFGIRGVDSLIGDFPSRSFTVLYGSPICLAFSFIASVRAQLPVKLGGLDSNVIFIDGGNDFNPYAISHICQLLQLDPKDFLEGIYISRAFTAYQLTSLIFERLEKAIDNCDAKLVIVSDVIRLFLDRDIPRTEAMNIFPKLSWFLRNVSRKKQVRVLATHLPIRRGRRVVFLEASLFGTADNLIRLEEKNGFLRVFLEKHLVRKPSSVEISWTRGNGCTLEKFLEV